MRRDWVAATDGSTGEMREEDDEDGRRGGAEVTRRRRRRGQPPWRGACCQESWGGNRSDNLFYFINLLSILLPFFLPSPTKLASSVVDERCHYSSSSFSSSSRFVAASKLHVALLVESIRSTSSTAVKRYLLASLTHSFSFAVNRLEICTAPGHASFPRASGFNGAAAFYFINLLSILLLFFCRRQRN